MSRYRVCFDGRWQGSFRDRDEALDWARAVGETDRIVHVARRRVLRLKLIAIFPEDREDEGFRLWKTRTDAAGGMAIGTLG